MNEQTTISESKRPQASAKKRPVWLRVVGILCVLATAWHIFATFLWIAPNNGLREMVPGKALQVYMSPTFSQNWSVFAPKPIASDNIFLVRAVVENDQGAERTEWVDAVSREMDLIHHNFFPARASLASNHLVNKYRGAYRDLTDEQQKSVGHNYFKGEDWSERYASALTEVVEKAGNSAKKDTREFIELEGIATAYATQVAKALWGDNVRSVQFRVGYQNIVPFSQRNEPDAERPAPSYITSGWRGTSVVSGQNEEKFAEVFASLEEVEKR
ncbi:DUF5819 family protein [Glutamicibacter uratoxydans]|uniref:DUF5819 family protein n=1 Tax=Glutamicibacter uratoxydans TaxID=43667 RepID=UPI003D6EE355